MEIRILGPIEMFAEGQRVEVGTPQTRAVLAIFVAHVGELVTVDYLIDELWGELAPKNARTLVQGYVWRLRRTFRAAGNGQAATGMLRTQRPGYVLQPGPDELDLYTFRTLLTQARRARDEGDVERAVGVFLRASQLWRGDPLADAPSCPSVVLFTAHLRELRNSSMEELFEAHLATRAAAEIVADLVKFVEENPLRERAVGQLMNALCMTGRRAEAVALFRRTRSLLLTELGMDPPSELEDLHVAILRGSG